MGPPTTRTTRTTRTTLPSHSNARGGRDDGAAAVAIKMLAARARAGRLTPDNIQHVDVHVPNLHGPELSLEQAVALLYAYGKAKMQTPPGFVAVCRELFLGAPVKR